MKGEHTSSEYSPPKVTDHGSVEKVTGDLDLAGDDGLLGGS